GFALAPKLWIVTRRAQAVSGGATAVAQAPVWGLGRVAANEHPDIWGGLVDVEGLEQDKGALADELCTGGGEDWVAYRGGERYVARLRRRVLPPPPHPGMLHRSGTYLITGGLGGIGLSVAQWLAAEGAGRIVLISRRGLDGHRQAPSAIEAMRAGGAEVWVRTADVSRRAELAKVVAEIYPSLRGIIHAAVVLDHRVLLRQDWSRFARVFAPKVHGAWNLHLLTRSKNLDFFILFSSASVYLGLRGLSNYAAANAFLIALAGHRRSQDLPAQTINWSGWRDLGMAAAVGAHRKAQWAEQGLLPQEPQEALMHLRELMHQPDAEHTIMPLDWESFMRTQRPGANRSVLDDLRAGAAPRATESRAAAIRLGELDAAFPRERFEMVSNFIRA